MSELKRYGLVRCSKKTGKIDTAMTGLGKGMLQLWGLQNTTKSKRTVIFELDTGIIEAMYTGTEDGFPEVEKGISSKGLMVNEDLRAEMAGEAQA